MKRMVRRWRLACAVRRPALITAALSSGAMQTIDQENAYTSMAITPYSTLA